jgi:hypothetical protein
MKLIELKNRNLVYMSSIKFISDWIIGMRKEVHISMLLQNSKWTCMDVPVYINDAVDKELYEVKRGW